MLGSNYINYADPLQHSYSLLNQHRNFTRIQGEDTFVRRYMRYLGHNEFGIDHKPWNTPQIYTNPDNLNYWLEQWLLFYREILEEYENSKNCFLVKYENLQNHHFLRNLLRLLDIKNDPEFKFKINNKRIAESLDESLYLESRGLFGLLVNNCRL